MRYILRMFSVFLALFSVVTVVSAQQPQLSFSIQTTQTTQSIVITGTGLPLYQNVFLTTTVISGSCKYNNQYKQAYIANTYSSGTFQYIDSAYCQGFVNYQVIVGSLVFSENVQLGQTVFPVKVDNCPNDLPLRVGFTVNTTKELDGWMLPSMGFESHGGTPLSHYKTGEELHIVQGPLCNDQGIWWRVSKRYSFLHEGVWVPTETVAWVLNTTNNTKTLFHNESMNEQVVNYPELSPYQPQAISVLSVQGQRIWNIPSIVTGVRVSVLTTADGPVNIIGTNANGAFFKIVKSDGTEGWICSHLTISNPTEFYIPVLDQTSEVCFK